MSRYTLWALFVVAVTNAAAAAEKFQRVAYMIPAQYEEGKPITSLSIQKPEQYVAVADGTQKVKVFTANEGRLAATLNSSDSRFTCVAFSRAGDLLLCGLADGQLQIYSAVTWKQVDALNPHDLPNTRTIKSDSDSAEIRTSGKTEYRGVASRKIYQRRTRCLWHGYRQQ